MSRPHDAERIGNAVRAHWDIEDGLHWLLAVAFDDDTRGVLNARPAENLAIVARMAFTLVKRDPTRKRGVAASRKKAWWDTDYLPMSSPRERRSCEMRLPWGAAAEGTRPPAFET